MSFRAEGMVSIWVGRKPVVPGSDFLRDQYGIDYYDPDSQECIVGDSISPLTDLVPRLSYSESFHDSIMEKAQVIGLVSALWVLAQYDFAYNPVKAGLAETPTEPLYLGNFPWHE